MAEKEKDVLQSFVSFLEREMRSEEKWFKIPFKLFKCCYSLAWQTQTKKHEVNSGMMKGAWAVE